MNRRDHRHLSAPSPPQASFHDHVAVRPEDPVPREDGHVSVADHWPRTCVDGQWKPQIARFYRVAILLAAFQHCGHAMRRSADARSDLLVGQPIHSRSRPTQKPNVGRGTLTKNVTSTTVWLGPSGVTRFPSSVHQCGYCASPRPQPSGGTRLPFRRDWPLSDLWGRLIATLHPADQYEGCVNTPDGEGRV